MPIEGFTLFETALGACAIAWSGQGVAGVQLPEGNPAATRARIMRRGHGAGEAPPPPAIADAMAGIAALLGGTRVDLSSVVLDMDGLDAFSRRVYLAARGIPPGRTATYGEIAAAVGAPQAAQAVGRALGRNPFAIIVPCHRVLAANGRAGGFSAGGGVATKLKLLAIENARRGSAPTLFD